MLRMKYGIALSLVVIAAVSLGYWGKAETGWVRPAANGLAGTAWALDSGSDEPAAPSDTVEPAPAPETPPEQPKTEPKPKVKPKTKPKPKPVAEEVAPTASAYLAPALLAQLTAALTTDPKKPAVVTAPENVTVLTAPDGYAVYFATVDEIRGAESEAGQSVAVEDIVFNDAHLIGYAPITFAVPSGDHVLAVRAMSRQNGFDGDCVRKATRDVVTGGRRFSYHLYPLRKRAGEYQCFVANFLTPEVKAGDLGAEFLARGCFAVPVADLVARLATDTGVPEAERESAAVSLNQLGVAFYRDGDTVHLVKLGLVGDGWALNEWPVEEDAAPE